MNESINVFLKQLKNQPEAVLFEQVMTVIDDHYDFTPVSFSNGAQNNKEGENNGSCKVFSFALLNQLNEEQTLSLFGQYYRDVKNTPDGDDHQNIRQFMLHGFSKLIFGKSALSIKG